MPSTRHARLREGKDFTVVPRSLGERPPAGTVSLTVLDDLPPVALELVWRRDSFSPSGTTLLDVVRRLGEDWAS